MAFHSIMFYLFCFALESTQGRVFGCTIVIFSFAHSFSTADPIQRHGGLEPVSAWVLSATRLRINVIKWFDKYEYGMTSTGHMT